MNVGLKKILATSALRFSGVALQTLVLIFVGRIAGPAGVGALQVFLTWTCSLGEGAAAGLPTQAMRQLANLKDDTAAAKAFLLAAVRRMLLVWATLMCSFAGFWIFGATNSAPELALIATSVFCFALYRIVSDGLKAFRYVDFSVLVESSLPPLTAGLALFVLVLTGTPLTIVSVLACFTLGFVVTALVIVLRFATILKGRGNKVSRATSIAWREHTPFWVSALISIAFLNFPFFVLPYYADLDEIGAFALAFKLLNIATTILLLLGAIFGPKFSQLAERKDAAGARIVLAQSRKLSLAVFLPIAIGLPVLFPFVHPWFGEGFAGGIEFLLILLIGQLCNAATGLSGQFLNMSGAGSTEMKIQICTVSFALLLTPFAGSLSGAIGIAWIYSTTVVLRSLASLYFAQRILNSRFPVAVQV